MFRVIAFTPISFHWGIAILAGLSLRKLYAVFWVEALVIPSTPDGGHKMSSGWLTRELHNEMVTNQVSGKKRSLVFKCFLKKKNKNYWLKFCCPYVTLDKESHLKTLLLSSHGFGYKKEAFIALAYGFAGFVSVFSHLFLPENR